MPKTGDMAPAGGERLLWREAMRDVKPLRGREPAILSPPLQAPAETGCVVKPHRLPGLDRFSGIDRANAERLKRGLHPIEGRLDLHGMIQAEAHGALAEARSTPRCRTALRSSSPDAARVRLGRIPARRYRGGSARGCGGHTGGRAGAAAGGAGALHCCAGVANPGPEPHRPRTQARRPKPRLSYARNVDARNNDLPPDDRLEIGLVPVTRRCRIITPAAMSPGIARRATYRCCVERNEAAGRRRQRPRNSEQPGSDGTQPGGRYDEAGAQRAASGSRTG